MQPLDVLDFIVPTNDMQMLYGLDSEGEELADAYSNLLNTPEGLSIVADLVARSGVMDRSDDDRQNGKRDVGIETLMIIQIGVDNERRRQDGRRRVE